MRFRYDKPLNRVEVEHKVEQQGFLSESLLITKEISPSIYQAFKEIQDSIRGELRFQVYVRASGESNAFVFRDEHETGHIVLTSSLVQLLDSAELSFVIGHEVGHLLFNHDRYKYEGLNHEKQLFLQRAQEISADRFGLLFTDNTSTAFRAIIKMISGLGSEHININIKKYIDQVKSLQSEIDSSNHSLYSTHPGFSVRVRALALFELSQPYYDQTGKSDKAVLDKTRLDEKVLEAMNQWGSVGLHQTELKDLRRTIYWFIAYKSYLSRDFDSIKADLVEEFGSAYVDNTDMILSGKGKSGIEIKLRESMSMTRPVLTILISEIDELKKLYSVYYEDGFDKLMSRLML